MMLALETFLFCGETLSVRTAQRLMQRFPACGVVNTYGPTESTVAVTQVVVTPQMVASGSPLPVGAPRPGTRLRVELSTRAAASLAPCSPVRLL